MGMGCSCRRCLGGDPSAWCHRPASRAPPHPACPAPARPGAPLAGLGCTLLWLAIAHRALPALPISIALAVAFYFVSRFVMEPVVLPMALQLVFF